MRQAWRLMLIGLLIACQSCATQMLWDNTDPKERIWIDADKTTEAALRRRGVAYEVYESPHGRAYLIEKSGWRKMGDYQLRVLGTPVALALDAATTVLVVGVYVAAADPEGASHLIRVISK